MSETNTPTVREWNGKTWVTRPLGRWWNGHTWVEDPVAACPDCGHYRDTPNHELGCWTSR